MSEEQDWRVGAGIPRRACLDKLTPAETAIVSAHGAVEALPPDERLSRAGCKLEEARNLVADFVDGVPLGQGYPRPAPSSDHEWRFMSAHGADGPGTSLDSYDQCLRCGLVRHDYRHNGGQRSPNYPIYLVRGVHSAAVPDCLAAVPATSNGDEEKR